ncbi:MAG: LPS export ABC transporter permease LptG [Syntrophobacterales bacterium RBG_19FT_COMBO_59_10]|nr:MAG: LPS export ABC transporter permease LptG [Syntrophobacterales bacterium RBG_19FT_COMBO_59_10]
MSILDRYLSGEFLRNMLFITACFISLFLIIDFFEKIRMFLSNQAAAGQMVSYFLFRIPMILAQILPAAVLVSSLITCGVLSRHSEITAMKANGISLYRISVPIALIAAMVCLTVFLLNEWVTPYANERAEHIRRIEVQKQRSLGSFKLDQIWYRGQRGIYNFRLFDPASNRLQGIAIHYLDSEMNLTMRLDAEWGEWKNDEWFFHNLLIPTFPPDSFPVLSRIQQQVVDIPERPSDFQVVQKSADAMGYFELKRYINKLRAEGYDATRYAVDLHGKVAFPLVGILLAVIGISFSLRSERSGGVAWGIGAGLVIGFSYWLVYAFGMSLGRSGALPPLIAAWLGNILFGAASVWMVLRIRT